MGLRNAADIGIEAFTMLDYISAAHVTYHPKGVCPQEPNMDRPRHAFTIDAAPLQGLIDHDTAKGGQDALETRTNCQA